MSQHDDEIAMRVVKRYAGHAVVDVVEAIAEIAQDTRPSPDPAVSLATLVQLRVYEAAGILRGVDRGRSRPHLTAAEVRKLRSLLERYSPPEPVG
ncbi:MAG TPA: hypothetical protein VFI34_07560 [Candidatus Limnocylindrales bacterium]|nr:hypothetical protein [Candidatus Limnocylindrales bacterium]